MILLQAVLALLSGAAVGFSLGIIGGGGSILAVPLLLYVVGIEDAHIAIGTSAFAVGTSYAQTSDTVGGKEFKGISVKFNADGTPGSSVGGAVWSRQTPAPPGGH